jgi:dipeptide transport system substrate-binding protein
MMQADLAKVGINATLVSYEWGEYRKRMQAGEHQMGFLGWTGDNGDPDNFLPCSAATSRRQAQWQNIPKWCDAKFHGTSPRRGDHRPGRAHQALRGRPEDRHDQVPWLNIAHSTVFEPIRKSVSGYKISPFGAHEFQNVDVAE